MPSLLVATKYNSMNHLASGSFVFAMIVPQWRRSGGGAAYRALVQREPAPTYNGAMVESAFGVLEAVRLFQLVQCLFTGFLSAVL